MSAQLDMFLVAETPSSEPVRNHHEPIESSSERIKSSSETSENLNGLAVPNHQSKSSMIMRFRTTSPKGEREPGTTHATDSEKGEVDPLRSSPPFLSRGPVPAGLPATPVLAIQNHPRTTPGKRADARSEQHGFSGSDQAGLSGPQTGALTARPYQTAAIEAVEKQFGAGIKRMLVVLPTGTGKTIVLALLLLRHKLKAEGRRARGLVLAHRSELIGQNAAKCRAAGLTTSIEQGASHANRSSDVVVASVQTLQRSRLIVLPRDEFDFIVVDEAHHVAARGYQNIVEYFFDALILGLTASPMRLDGKPLGDTFQTTAFSLELRQAIADEWLVPIIARRVRITDVDMSGVKAAHGDLAKEELGAVLRDAKALQGVVGPLLTLAGSRRTLVFAVDVAHAHALADLLNKHRAGSALAIDGTMPDGKRRALLELFRAGTIQYLVNCEILTEGFDDPGIQCVALARPTMSVALLIQMVGRGTRLLGLTYAESVAAGKRDVLVLDFVGNLRHRLATPADALAGMKLPDELAVEVAKELDTCKPLDVSLVLAEAEKNAAEEIRRKAQLALSYYRTKEVDPFVGEFMGDHDQANGAPATESQLRRLEAFGFSNPPEGVTSAHAQAIIDAAVERDRRGLSTLPQIRLLRKLGADARRCTRKRATELVLKVKERGYNVATLRGEPEYDGRTSW